MLEDNRLIGVLTTIALSPIDLKEQDFSMAALTFVEALPDQKAYVVIFKASSSHSRPSSSRNMRPSSGSF